jgi:L-asparaginase
MSRVAAIFTGGTISMVSDPAAGGNVPVLDGAALIAATRGLEEIAEVVALDLGRTPASHFSWPRLFGIAAAIRDAQADPGIDGVVVVQGTDTLEETSFLWDLLLDRPEPVAVTGAMRAASDPEPDGPRNLRDAVRCAATPALRDAGVVVVMDGTVHAADAVTKAHASALDAFRSLDTGPLGRVVDAKVELSRARGPRRHVAAEQAAEGVTLVTVTLAMDGRLVDAAAELGAPGIVVEATGSGNTDPRVLEAAMRAMGQGIEIALTTRCASGAVSEAYAFPGGGHTWAEAGALLVGHLSGPKARVALAAGLGAKLGHGQLAELLADPPGWLPSG